MFYKCANDCFGYCSGTPEWDRPPDKVEVREGEGGYLAAGNCKLNPDSCGKYQTLSQQLAGKELPRSDNRRRKRAK